MNPEDEVRRCANCGKPTLICVSAWQHSTWGVRSNIVTRDCQCQACGVKATLHPGSRIFALWVVAVLLLPSVIPALIFALVALRRSRAWSKNPLVPGAPRPPIRFRAGPADRRCECGRVATLAKVTRHRTNWIPTGTEQIFKCGTCGEEFVIESVGGLLVTSLGASLLGAIAVWVLTSVESSMSRWGWGLGLTLVTVVLLGQLVSRVAAFSRHPELPERRAANGL